MWRVSIWGWFGKKCYNSTILHYVFVKLTGWCHRLRPWMRNTLSLDDGQGLIIPMHIITSIMAWVSNHIHIFCWVITHLCINFKVKAWISNSPNLVSVSCCLKYHQERCSRGGQLDDELTWCWTQHNYHQTSNRSRTLVRNKIVDHLDVVGASPVGAAPTTSSFST